MAESQLNLGIIERILDEHGERRHAGGRGAYALLRPLYRSTDFPGWLPVEDAERDFPVRGYVLWRSPPADATAGSPWQFVAAEDRGERSDDTGHDLFSVAERPTLMPAREVIDLRRDDQPFVSEIVRREVAEEGLWLKFIPSSHAYLWVDEETWIGPVHLTQHDGKWRASTVRPERHFVGEYSFPAGAICELHLDGGSRFFLTPDAQTGAPRRSFDWSPDVIVLGRVLRWMQRVDPGYADAAGLTREAISRAVALTSSEEEGEAATRTQQLQRALALVPSLEENQGLARTIIEDLLGIPSVAARIRTAEDDQRGSVQEHTGERVLRAPQADAADATAEHPAVAVRRLSLPPWAERDGDGARRLREPQELRHTLTETFAARGFDERVARTLHSALISGVMPVLAGDAAYEAVEGYAARAVGGRLLWLSVPATTLEPGDLLGRHDAAARRFVPHPGGLLDLLLYASRSEDLFLVVLDGINRAPVASYLTPILSLYADARADERQRRALPVVHPNALAPDDLYAAATRLTWSPNVLLVGIWDPGVIGMPTPATFWSNVALIGVDQSSTDAAGGSRELIHTDNDTPLATATRAVWDEWRVMKAAPSRKLDQVVGQLARGGLGMSRRRKSWCNEFYTEVLRWTEKDDEALRDAIACCIAPQIVASDRDHLLLEVVEQVGGAATDISSDLQSVRSLLS